MENIIPVVLVIVTVGVGFLAVYFGGKSKVLAVVAEYIAMAEELYKSYTKAGGQKMEWVVDQLYSLLPAPVRIIITRTVVESLVQSIFDCVSKYATLQLDKLIGTEKKD